ncbi:hypothetical protein GCM10010309_37650 [Streptomyces violaceochromogenes]|nr:hypothetical protein GCM10010309_37650 [Streptomyces violaceochromogenes]
MIRVVVVDDEALVRSGFGLILGASVDIEVVATASGGEAVQTVRRERPDVVLLDIRSRTSTGSPCCASCGRCRTLRWWRC